MLIKIWPGYFVLESSMYFLRIKAEVTRKFIMVGSNGILSELLMNLPTKPVYVPVGLFICLFGKSIKQVTQTIDEY